MKAVASLEEMAEQLLADCPVAHELELRLAGWSIRVASNNDRLIKRLADYFRPFVRPGQGPHLTVLALETPEVDTALPFQAKEPEPGKSKIKEEWADLPGGRVVRKRLTGMVFAFGNGIHLAAGPCLANCNQVVNFINNRLIQLELNRRCLLAHAAGVKSDSVGLALAGFSGMGKSTLALHLMSRGVNFVSNDRLLIRRRQGRVEMTGVPKLPRINPGTALNNADLAGVIPAEDRERFARVGGDEIWELEHKYDVDLELCFGPDRFELQSGLDVLAILNWRRGEGDLKVAEVDLAARPDLLAAFKKDWGLFFLTNGTPPDHSDAAYLRELSGVKVLELSGGLDFMAAARVLAAELEQGA